MSAVTGTPAAAVILAMRSTAWPRPRWSPSGEPRLQETPALVVAIARAPASSMIRALATSQAFTSIRGAGPACSERNSSALVVVMVTVHQRVARGGWQICDSTLAALACRIFASPGCVRARGLEGAGRRGALRAGRAVQGCALRWLVLHRGDHYRRLLPAQLPGTTAEGPEHAVLPECGRSAARRIPRVQTMPARR